jgi:eukaryotic-like serine/threonine-protein kinase
MKRDGANVQAGGGGQAAKAALPPPGTVYGGHRLDRLLGTGGFGAVYEATHIFTERRVALKLLLPREGDTEDERARARKEAIALCRLRHKNVVSVHSADVLPDGTVWIAMELLDGQLLRRICEVESPLSPERALYIAIEIADGLAAAHDLGIIHRDVKPENVFIEVSNQVKILDLNIAKVSVDGMQSTNQEGLRFGTTAYLPPEACWGAPWSFAGDVYSLGVVLYEMLAGRHPFGKGRRLEGLPNAGQLIAAHMVQFPAPLHEVEPSVPEYFWPVLLRLLAKQPDERLQNGAVAASALRGLQALYAAEPRSGRPPAATSAPAAPGARREHRGPRAPARSITVPMLAEPRVIVAGTTQEHERGPETASMGTAPTEAAEAVDAPPVTPAPVMVPFARQAAREGSSPSLPPTARALDRRRRARLLRRCAVAALLAVPISGGSTALYVHLTREHAAAAAPTGTSAALETTETTEVAAAASIVPAAAVAPAPDAPAATAISADVTARSAPASEDAEDAPARPPAAAATAAKGRRAGAPAARQAAEPRIVKDSDLDDTYPTPAPAPAPSAPAARPAPPSNAPPRPF